MCQETNKQKPRNKTHDKKLSDYWNKYKNMQKFSAFVEKPQIWGFFFGKMLVFPLSLSLFHLEIEKNMF